MVKLCKPGNLIPISHAKAKYTPVCNGMSFNAIKIMHKKLPKTILPRAPVRIFEIKTQLADPRLGKSPALEPDTRNPNPGANQIGWQCSLANRGQATPHNYRLLDCMVSLSFDSIYWLELLKIEMFAMDEYIMRGVRVFGCRIICEDI